ncbi:MAG: hypothetical protein Q4F54_05005 [Coriobacteriia bacterium]|nr:hypothetical protein [Coriobacteriia bacterium]
MGLETIKTAIQFVSSGGGGTEPTAQTGDALALLMILLALVVTTVACGLYVAAKARKFALQSGHQMSIIDSLKTKTTLLQKIAIIIAGASLLVGAGLLVAKGPVLHAFAAEKNEGVITVVVDDNNGSIVSVDKGQLANESNGDFYIYESFLTAADDTKDIAGVSDIQFNIKSENTEVYAGTASGTKYTPDNNYLIPYQNTTQTTYEISNITAETAKALVGKTGFTLTLCPKNVTIVTYDSNGATAGEVPAPTRVE